MRAVLILGLAFFVIPSFVVASSETAPLPPSPICGGVADPTPAKPAVEILAGYGTGGFDIQTRTPRAQAFFTNGMQLAHAFAHKAATNAFAEAVKLDPDCAMCLWGEAWSRGPTINYTIERQDQAELRPLVDKAARLAGSASPRDRMLIAALQKRYVDGGGKGRGDYAFARAMDEIARAYPDDNEVAIITADAWMIPASNKETQENLPRAVELLEGALKRQPNDTGAIHFYIHATEMSGFGGRAEPYADKLATLAPSASHLVHMPSHTFYLVGRYGDALSANQQAAKLDGANAQRQGLTGPDGIWKLTYHAHNVQFGIGGAMMDGDGPGALALAKTVLDRPPSTEPDGGFAQYLLGSAYFAYGRYADRAQVLALADPGVKQPYARAMWRYARGEAAARAGDAAAVRAEAAQIAVPSADLKGFDYLRPQIGAMVSVARGVLTGRGAMLEGRPQDAAMAYRDAAMIQEKTLRRLSDPPAWWYPVRRSYAAALLAAGEPARATAEAETTLKRAPKDPLTLVVLSRAAAAQDRKAEADQRLAQAKAGWTGAFVAPPAGLI
ncbi:hypothetical protein [Phenylobacterium aquaticum]|uniref:hypothetical protein n=1 Tax=Phenylobacterium aquaticum TaxID=1763816 RepID=UPI0026EB04A6|nr:hypothetical protein [Phenylobacterium aquaticum]